MKTIFSYLGYPLSESVVFPLIKSAGFDGILLWWSDGIDPNYRSHPEIARKAGLFVENIHLPFDNSNDLWIDNLDGEEILKRHLKCIDDCAEFDIPTMVMHASVGEALPISEIGLRRFALLIEKAEEKQVNIALENMRRKSQLIQTAALLEQFESPRIGLCFDSGHYHARLFHEAECDLLDRFGNRIMALHLHDNKSVVTGKTEDDQHLLPFDGTIDWSGIMKKIRGKGCLGATALEVMNSGYENSPPEEFLRLAFERAERLESLK